MHALIERVESRELVIIDGGTGTELERRGAPMNSDAWSAMASLDAPDILLGVHRDYIEAGAGLIIANTYPASRHVMDAAGLGHKFEEVNRRAVEIARRAAEQSGRPVAVAGSISTTTFTDNGSLDYGRLPDENAALEYYRAHADVLADAGCDLIILEMMRDVEQTSYALRAARQSGLPVWVGFSCQEGEGGGLMLYGGSGPLGQAVAAIGSLRPHAVGVMHSQMEITPRAVAAIAGRWSGPVFAYPHRGVFEMPNWRFTDTVTPEDFAGAAVDWVRAGATIIGGCCGIGPEHIAELSRSLSARLSGVL